MSVGVLLPPVRMFSHSPVYISSPSGGLDARHQYHGARTPSSLSGRQVPAACSSRRCCLSRRTRGRPPGRNLPEGAILAAVSFHMLGILPPGNPWPDPFPRPVYGRVRHAEYDRRFLRTFPVTDKSLIHFTYLHLHICSLFTLHRSSVSFLYISFLSFHGKYGCRMYSLGRKKYNSGAICETGPISFPVRKTRL